MVNVSAVAAAISIMEKPCCPISRLPRLHADKARFARRARHVTEPPRSRVATG